MAVASVQIHCGLAQGPPCEASFHGFLACGRQFATHANPAALTSLIASVKIGQLPRTCTTGYKVASAALAKHATPHFIVLDTIPNSHPLKTNLCSRLNMVNRLNRPHADIFIFVPDQARTWSSGDVIRGTVRVKPTSRPQRVCLSSQKASSDDHYG